MNKRKQLTKKIDELFNLSVKLIEGKCFTCGKPVLFNDKWKCSTHDASHFISKGSSYALRWDYQNVHCQCKKCHIEYHNSDPTTYYKAMEKKYDIEKLRSKKRDVIKFSIQDLEDIYKNLKEKVKELKGEVCT